MQRKASNHIEWLEFDLLADITEVTHGVVLRHGGVSQGAFASLNVCNNVGDTISAVQANRVSLCSALHLPKLQSVKQVHGAHIVTVTASHHSGQEADAMVTASPGMPLFIKHADCQVALIVDPVRHVTAAVHSGWRGNVQNIYSKVVDYLKGMGCHPANLLVGISPSLGPQHAEFVHYRQEFPRSFWDYQVTPNYFDLWAIGRDQLVNAGVLPHHIEVARQCTYANDRDFFSYRRDKVTGRHGSFVMLKKQR